MRVVVVVVVGSRADEDESRGNLDFERHLHSLPSRPLPPLPTGCGQMSFESQANGVQVP